MFRHVRLYLPAVMIAAIVASLALVAPVGAEPGFSALTYLPQDVSGTNNGSEPFAAMSCPSPGNCEAVGPSAGGDTHDTPSAIAETDGVWGSATALTLPGNAVTAAKDDDYFTQVTCWAAGDCVAVGTYEVDESIFDQETPTAVPMWAMETSGVWGDLTEITDVTSDPWLGLVSGVACDGSGDCTLTGSFTTLNPSTLASSSEAFVESESAASGTWTSPTTIATGAFTLPLAIACTATTSCIVIDASTNAQGDDAPTSSSMITESSGTWEPPVAFAKVHGNRFLPSSISCPDANDCVLVGATAPTFSDLVNNVDEEPAAQIETGGVWAATADLPLPLLAPVATGGTLVSVSCASAGACEAVGWAAVGAKSADGQAMAVTLNGTTWSQIGYQVQPVKVGTKAAASTGLGVVSCLGADACEALGASSLGAVNSSAVGGSYVLTLVPSLTASLPGRPSDVKVAVTDQKATISFLPPTADGGARIEYFEVTAKASGAPAKSCVTPVLSCSISHLVAGKHYAVTVEAKNKVGFSKPTPAVIAAVPSA